MSTGKDSRWFPHDADALDDPKIMLLVMQLGMEGYGLYWMLIESLLKQNGYMLPVNLIEPLSRRFQVSKEKLETIVSKYDLFEVSGDYFFSPSLSRRMEVYDNKKELNRQNVLKRWNGKNNTTVLPPYYDRNTKTKQNITKQNKTKEENSLYTLSFCSDSFRPVWEKWVDYKKKIGKPYKTIEGMETKYKALVSLSGGDPKIAMMIVDQSIGEEWSGLFALKNNISRTTDEDPVEKGIREVKEARRARLAREAAEKEKLQDMLTDIELETMMEDGDKE